MIKQALEYLIGLGKTEIVEVNELQYSTNALHLIQDPSPDELRFCTLTGLIDYIRKDVDFVENIFIHIESFNRVKIYSTLREDFERNAFVICSARTPSISLNSFMDVEKFNIMLQSCFLENMYRNAILKVIGNLREENVRTTGDDGVSQMVSAKTGIARVEDVVLPNPVRLAPYRTFQEIEQPESSFVFRMKDGPTAALFEADGGAWELSAMYRIKEYLDQQLHDLGIAVIA